MKANVPEEKRRVHLAKPRPCAFCEKVYTPQEYGWRGIYCSQLCKGRSYKIIKPQAREYRRKASAKTYRRIMADPVRRASRRNYSKTAAGKTRGWLSQYKLDRGCIDCGFRAHSSALQLDHEGKKSIEIADARSSIGRLKAEIAAGKCVVRCANCHSIKTWAQKNGLNYKKVRVQLGLAKRMEA